MAASGVEQRSDICPPVIDLSSESAAWPLGRVAQGHTPVVVDQLGAQFGEVHGGPFPEAITSAIVVPPPSCTSSASAEVFGRTCSA